MGPSYITKLAVPAATGLVLAAALLLAAPSSASVPTGTPSPWESDDPRPTSITSDVECEVVHVGEERTLVVRDDHGREHQVTIPEDAKIRARRKRDFDGLRKLGFEHLQVGFRLKLTFLKQTGEITRVKVLEVDPA